MLKLQADKDPLHDRELMRSSLISWFLERAEDHPWRRTRDPWAILVSEVMLQQTTIATVRGGRRFELFMEEFPDLETIAQAPEEALLKAWEGLGYYNRVRNLQRTACAVISDWEGKFPRTAKELETLPGIGAYTAGAVASFAFDAPAPIVDGNIARVLSRLFDFQEQVDDAHGRRMLWTWAGELVDPKSSRNFNSALMELGQFICRPKKPDCFSCPLAKFCQTREPEKLPIKRSKQTVVHLAEKAVWAQDRGMVLLAKEAGSRRKGFWRLPLRSSDQVADLEKISTSRYAITKHRVTLDVYRCDSVVPGGLSEGEEWVALADLDELPMVAPVRKILAKLVQSQL
ncbi:MAG: A/G-specific adenine glycosylase [Verrucomicrobiota bacterium JB023]|nr:A/G-specific adenine glycosylase [Verrucomicrobiota bacterium JB023]